MHGVNKVTLIGNVGKDPETRYLESGVPVTSFSLATSETHKNRHGDKISTTEWHNIVLWRGLAEIAEKFVRKGDALYVEGKLRTRSWEDKEGRRRHTTEIIGTNMIMLTKRDRRGEGLFEDTRDEQAPPLTEDDIDHEEEEATELPF